MSETPRETRSCFLHGDYTGRETCRGCAPRSAAPEAREREQEPPAWVQIQAGSELAELVRLVRFVPGQPTGFLHSQFDAERLLWRWFLKWREAAPPAEARAAELELAYLDAWLEDRQPGESLQTCVVRHITSARLVATQQANDWWRSQQADPRADLRRLVEQWRTEAAESLEKWPRGAILPAKKLRACADELEAALQGGIDPPQEQDWQPIETAPKDGTSILVAQAGTDRVNRAFWMPESVRGFSHWCVIGGFWEPTHWQPLPPAPRSTPPPEGE